MLRLVLMLALIPALLLSMKPLSPRNPAGDARGCARSGVADQPGVDRPSRGIHRR